MYTSSEQIAELPVGPCLRNIFQANPCVLQCQNDGRPRQCASEFMRTIMQNETSEGPWTLFQKAWEALGSDSLDTAD